MGCEKRKSPSTSPSSSPTMRRIMRSKASSEATYAMNSNPCRVSPAQGIERRTMNAAGSKLSCAVRLTCAVSGASSSSSLVSASRPITSLRSRGVMRWNRSRSWTQRWTAAKLEPSAATAAAGAAPPTRPGRRRLALRILGAVLEAREVAAASIFEEVHRVLGDERVGEEGSQVARGVEEGAAVGPAEQEPERLLRGRDAATWSRESGKDTQARDRLAEGEHRGKTHADDAGGGWMAIAQAAQRGRAVGFGGNAEGEASRYGCMRLEDPGLRFGHAFRCSTRSQDSRPDERMLAARPRRGSSVQAEENYVPAGGVPPRAFRTAVGGG